jgi:hypothetical protein
MKTMISMGVCKRRLAILWFVGGFLLFLVFILQSMFGKYGAKTEEAWAWFLPTVMPTISLVAGVMVSDAISDTSGGKRIRRFFFRLAMAFSVIYLSMVALIPLVQPFTGTSVLELMSRSNFWLSPLQGLVVAVLGIFFTKAEKEQ